MKKPKPSKSVMPPPEASGEVMSTYIFSFELTKQYPTVRSFIIKMPLKKSFSDSLADLLGKTK